MKTKLTLAILILTTTMALAATYVYKCPSCGYIMSFNQPAFNVKCPRDGWGMVRQ